MLGGDGGVQVNPKRLRGYFGDCLGLGLYWEEEILGDVEPAWVVLHGPFEGTYRN